MSGYDGFSLEVILRITSFLYSVAESCFGHGEGMRRKPEVVGVAICTGEIDYI